MMIKKLRLLVLTPLLALPLNNATTTPASVFEGDSLAVFIGQYKRANDYLFDGKEPKTFAV